MVLTGGVEPPTLCPSNKGLFQLGYVSSYFLTQNCQSENDSLGTEILHSLGDYPSFFRFGGRFVA